MGSIYASRFRVMVNNRAVRIEFGNSIIQSAAAVENAYVLSSAEAKELGDFLVRRIDQIAETAREPSKTSP